MIIQLMRLVAQRHSVHHRMACAFHMGNEIAVRAAGQDSHLYAGFAQRGEIFNQLQLLAGIGAGQLHQPPAVRDNRRDSWRGNRVVRLMRVKSSGFRSLLLPAWHSGDVFS